MKLYSIGHSNTEISAFVTLLQRYGIELLADTRSQPYSRYAPQFGREKLKQSLAEADIAYFYLGAQLGGRPADRRYYLADGKVDYVRLAHAPFFLHGLEQLLSLAEEQHVAFLCSEANYLHCHRYWLITRVLVGRGIEVQHILHSGEVITSTAADFEPAQPSLF